MTEDGTTDLDNNMMCAAVLLDFTAAASDIIENKFLLQKLENYGYANLHIDERKSFSRKLPCSPMSSINM